MARFSRRREKFFVCSWLVLVVLGFAVSFFGIGEAKTQACQRLLGTGTPNVDLTFVIVPCSFNPTEAPRFEMLADSVANAYSPSITGEYVKNAIDPYASNQDKFSIWRVDDYSGTSIPEGSCGFNPLLFTAANSACGFGNAQLIAIANNSGEVEGNPGRKFTVVGSGTPPSCDPTTCNDPSCPIAHPPFNCSWDYSIKSTALHETGHTVYDFGHNCYTPQGVTKNPALAGPNCSGDNMCAAWNTAPYTSYIEPTDPTYGCYQGCDDIDNWYRPWQPNAGLMCRDDKLEFGFTPIEKKLIADFLGVIPPQCSDGADNDGDALTDFPIDPGCTDFSDNDETNAGNVPPSVTISSPVNDSSFTFGTNVTFTGSATDREDGTVTASLAWTSNIDGQIGIGESFSTNSLSTGSHTITVSVTDSGNLSSNDSINIAITASAPEDPPPSTPPPSPSVPARVEAPPESFTFPESKPESGGDLVSLIEGIINWVFVVLILTAVIFILLAAFQFIAGGGSTAAMAEARSKLMWAAVGIVVALLAKVIPMAIHSIVAGPK